MSRRKVTTQPCRATTRRAGGARRCWARRQGAGAQGAGLVGARLAGAWHSSRGRARERCDMAA